MKYVSAAIGNFDGIHIGHDAIIQKAIEMGHCRGQSVKVITFEYEFDKFTNIAKKYQKIYGKHGKMASLKSYPIDDILFFSLNQEMAAMSPESFIKDILVNELNIRTIVVGFNFRFGHKAKGDTLLLQKLSQTYHYDVHVIEAVKKDNQIISSSRIRELIKSGEIEQANQLLVDPYRIDFRDHQYQIHKNQVEIVEKDYVYPPSGKYLVTIEQDTCEITLRESNHNMVLDLCKNPNVGSIEFIKKL